MVGGEDKGGFISARIWPKFNYVKRYRRSHLLLRTVEQIKSDLFDFLLPY